MLKVDGTKTFLWFDALATKVAKPNGLSKSTLMNTGLAVYPLLISTLKSDPSGISPALLEKYLDHSSLLFSATVPLERVETLLPFL
jgi:hypothetical protein